MTTTVMPEQDIIDGPEAIAIDFFRDILGLDYQSCFVSDISHLSDFSLSNTPPGVDVESATLSQLYDAWDAWVLPQIKAHFGIELQSTNVMLVTVFDQIERLRIKKLKQAA